MSNNDIVIKIKIYWVRHGFSCANFLYAKFRLTHSISDKSTLAPDAKLTNTTLKKICEMKNDNTSNYYRNILNSDFILCSELTRAIETAMMLFGTFNKTIYIVPYVGEEVNTSYLDKTDNIPSNNHIKSNNIQNIINYYNINKNICGSFNSNVSFEILNNLIDDNHTEPDFNKFLTFVVPYLITKYKTTHSNNDMRNLTLTIVSHHQFIKKTTLLPPKNLEIILQNITTSYSIIDNNYKYNKMSYCNHNYDLFNILNNKLNKHGAMAYSTTKYGIINHAIDLANCDYSIINNVIKKK